MSEAALPPGRPSLRGLTIELILFAALAAFGLVQWARLFASPPVADLLAALVVACAGALALGLVARSGLRPGLRFLVAGLAALASLVGALLAVGLPLRLLGPENWDELGVNLGDGLARVEDTDLPYGGEETWMRLTLLLGAALMLALAAALAFWPGANRPRARMRALVALVAIYAVATVLDSPGSELVWGVGLLLLAVAWLWLPEVELSRGAAGLLIALAAGVAALPIAARIENGQAWWDYESWDVFGDERTVTFDWNHSYGPLDWPQRGTTLLEVESELPLYWKASVLDRFDGFTWRRAAPNDPLSGAEVAARRSGPSTASLALRNPEWKLRAAFEVRALESGLVIGSGTPLALQGTGDARPTIDGTVLAGSEPLERDDVYAIETYAPQPSPGRLRAAPQTYPSERFGAGALVGLPAFTPEGSSGFATGPTILVPSWGEPVGGDSTAAILASQYADVYRLATDLTEGAPTVYDAVREVERHLQTSYDYSPNIDNATYPLSTFLFEDGSGYCQHFAGSMALMLRMVGIPSRVVSGFAPGRYESELSAYEVRDTDAHAWVEVYFRGIGWVTFDPTPSAAPAAAQTLESGGPLVLRRDGSTGIPERGDLRSIESALPGGSVPNVDQGGGIWGAVGIAVLVAIALAATVAAAAFLAGRRRLAAADAVELQARELTTALESLGWSLDNRVTLFGIERRFETAGRPVIAGYAAALRRNRFGASGSRAPDARERRRLRRALATGGGVGRRLQALRAVPPGGPDAR